MDAIFPNFAAFQWFYGNIVAGFSKKALVIKDVNSEGCELMEQRCASKHDNHCSQRGEGATSETTNSALGMCASQERTC